MAGHLRTTAILADRSSLSFLSHPTSAQGGVELGASGCLHTPSDRYRQHTTRQQSQHGHVGLHRAHFNLRPAVSTLRYYRTGRHQATPRITFIRSLRPACVVCIEYVCVMDYRYAATAVCLALMAREITLLREEIDLAWDEEDEEAVEQADVDDDDERQAAEAMQCTASTDDEQAEWMDEAAIQPHTKTPITDDEYDGSITPTPSRSSSLSTHAAGQQEQLPFHSIAADRRQLCELHGKGCPSNHTHQSRAAIVTSKPRHLTPPFDRAHQQLVNTLTSPAGTPKRPHHSLFSPPSAQLHSQYNNNSKENLSPNSSLHTPPIQPTLKTSPQSAFSTVKRRSPRLSANRVPLTSPASSSAARNGTAAESKRRKTVHASLARSFQSLPVEQQQLRGSGGSACGGSMASAAVARSHRMPR